jgi:hypothetical protein
MGVSKKLAELRSRAGSAKQSIHAGMAELRVLTPDLAEILTPQIEDGKEIPGATILIFGEKGCIKACVTDRAQGMRFFHVVTDTREFWKELCGAVYDPHTDWRPCGPPPKR